MKKLILFILLMPCICFAETNAYISGIVVDAGGGSTITDDFNRADGALGANWTTDSTSAASLTISTNAVVSGTGGTDAYSAYTGDTFANDQYSQVDISNISGYQGVTVRMDGNGNGYAFLAINSSLMAFYKLTAGSRSVIGSGVTVDGSNSTIKLTATGTTLEAFIDGVSQGTRTGQSDYSAGDPGIYNNQSGATNSIDNFEAGDI